MIILKKRIINKFASSSTPENEEKSRYFIIRFNNRQLLNLKNIYTNSPERIAKRRIHLVNERSREYSEYILISQCVSEIPIFTFPQYTNAFSNCELNFMLSVNLIIVYSWNKIAKRHNSTSLLFSSFVMINNIIN